MAVQSTAMILTTDSIEEGLYMYLYLWSSRLISNAGPSGL